MSRSSLTFPRVARSAIHRQISERLVGLPFHAGVLEKAIAAFCRRKGVVGLYLSGSVAHGFPDVVSDIDLLVVTSDAGLKGLWDRRKQTEASIGRVRFRLDLKEVMPTSCAAYFDNGVKLHVTYVALSHLPVEAEFRGAVRLFGEHPALIEWASACESEQRLLDVDGLKAQDERFWFWLLQGAAKIGRGELWAAFDTLHVLRTIIVSFTHAARGSVPQGYRRLEVSWDEASLHNLRGTIAQVREGSLRGAYSSIAGLYEAVRREVSARFGVRWRVSRGGIEFVHARLLEWLGEHPQS